MKVHGREVIRILQLTAEGPDGDRMSAIGKRLSTCSGVDLGRITDVIVDLGSGLILGFELDDRRIAPAVPPTVERRDRVVIPDRAQGLVGEDLAALNAITEIGPTGEVQFVVVEDLPDGD